MPGLRGPRGPQLPRSGVGGAPAAVASPASLSPDPSTLPELVVEWLPNAAPNVTDGVWEAMTSYVVAGSTQRGRRYEIDQFGAGRLTLTLNTFDRMFDPENTAGTYYGKLKPMRQIRVGARWQGVYYPIFRGYVTSWGQTTRSDKMFETTIEARDAFERLEQIRLPSSAWALEIQKDNPSCWLRLGESDTTRLTDSSPGGNYGVYDNCQQGVKGLVVNDSDGAVQFAHSFGERVVIQNPTLISGFPFTFSCMFQIDNTEPAGAKLIFSGLGSPPSTTTNVFHIFMDYTGSAYAAGTGNIVMSFTNASSGGFYVWSNIRVDDNKPHHLACVVGSSAQAASFIYIDGVDVTTRGGGTGGTWAITPPNGWGIGNYVDLKSGDFGFGANADSLGVASQQVHRGTIDEVCVWNGVAVTADRIAAHSLAAKSGWNGDQTGTRVSRFLDRIGWPSDLRDIATGISTLGPASWSAGSSALSVLQSWADTEAGAFFVGRDGKIVWRSRHYPLLDLTARRSQAAIGDVRSTNPIKVAQDGLQLVRDATQIRNPVTASRTNGVSVTVRDDNLADQVYGDRTWSSPTTEDQKDSVVRDRATWLLSRYKQERLRLASVTIPVRQQPRYWPTVLGLELGSRISVGRTPLGLNSETAVDQIVEGIEWRFGGFTLEPTLTGSPVDSNVGAYLILDDAAEGLIGLSNAPWTVDQPSDVFTFSDTSNVQENTPIRFTAIGAVSQLDTTTTFYAVNTTQSTTAGVGGTFKIAVTPGGIAADIVTNGSGTVSTVSAGLLAY